MRRNDARCCLRGVRHSPSILRRRLHEGARDTPPYNPLRIARSGARRNAQTRTVAGCRSCEPGFLREVHWAPATNRAPDPARRCDVDREAVSGIRVSLAESAMQADLAMPRPPIRNA